MSTAAALLIGAKGKVPTPPSSWGGIIDSDDVQEQGNLEDLLGLDAHAPFSTGSWNFLGSKTQTDPNPCFEMWSLGD